MDWLSEILEEIILLLFSGNTNQPTNHQTPSFGSVYSIYDRDVKNIDEAGLQKSLESLRDNGFLNYFGMQRFGTSSIMTHTIGREIMKKNFEEASNMILYPREGGK